MAVTIRDATAQDAASIAELLTQLGYQVGPAAIPERLDRVHGHGDRVLLAETGGRVAGLAHLQIVPALEHAQAVAKIGALVVDAGCRGLGIGRALVDAAQAEADRRGCSLVYLTTSEGRDDAHAFYERLGFAQTGRRYGRTASQ